MRVKPFMLIKNLSPKEQYVRREKRGEAHTAKSSQRNALSFSAVALRKRRGNVKDALQRVGLLEEPGEYVSGKKATI